MQVRSIAQLVADGVAAAELALARLEVRKLGVPCFSAGTSREPRRGGQVARSAAAGKLPEAPRPD